jgi:hypothetical protein
MKHEAIDDLPSGLLYDYLPEHNGSPQYFLVLDHEFLYK